MEGYGTILLLPEAERRVKLNGLERSISKNAPLPSTNQWKHYFLGCGQQADNGGDPNPNPNPNQSNTTAIIAHPTAKLRVVSLFQSFKKRRTTKPTTFGAGPRITQATQSNQACSTAAKPTFSHNLAIHRLIRFRHVLRLASTAPWANKQFAENEAMTTQLIAAHLALIVGADEWKAHKGDCFSLLDSTTNLGSIQNVCWITNRQQGKTSTLSRFLACLAFTSVKGGNLCCVYSTSLDRSCELVKAAKKYLYWFTTDARAKATLRDAGMEPPIIMTDNERAFSVRAVGDGSFQGSGDSTPSSTVNTVIGRPKAAESCRGDAPACAMFDEIGFVNPDFWKVILVPPPSLGSHLLLIIIVTITIMMRPPPPL